MDRFSISHDVARLLPNMQVVIVAAYNLDNGGTNAMVDQFAENAATSALSSLSAYPNAQSHPRIALYRDTLKAKCGLSAKKFPQSNESLCKRLLKEKAALRPISPVVDFYNSVSIKHAVTAGAFDLGGLQTRSIAPLELRLSRSGGGSGSGGGGGTTSGAESGGGRRACDTFKALDAPVDAEPVPLGAGELVYAQAGTVLTRHLAWRQAAEGLVTDRTRNVIFMSEILEEVEQQNATEPTALARSVADDLVDGLRQFFGVEAQATFLGEGLGKLDVEVQNAFF